MATGFQWKIPLSLWQSLGRGTDLGMRTLFPGPFSLYTPRGKGAAPPLPRDYIGSLRACFQPDA